MIPASSKNKFMYQSVCHCVVYSIFHSCLSCSGHTDPSASSHFTATEIHTRYFGILVLTSIGIYSGIFCCIYRNSERLQQLHEVEQPALTDEDKKCDFFCGTYEYLELTVVSHTYGDH